MTVPLQKRLRYGPISAKKLVENPEDIKLLLSTHDSIDGKWSSVSSRLYEAASQSIGCKSRKHQEWIKDNTDAMPPMLKGMQEAHSAVLNNPTSAALSSNGKHPEERCSQNCMPCRMSSGYQRQMKSNPVLIKTICTTFMMQ